MITFILNTVLQWRFDTRWSTDPTRGTAMFEFEMDHDRMDKAYNEEAIDMLNTVARVGKWEALFWFVCFTLTKEILI